MTSSLLSVRLRHPAGFCPCSFQIDKIMSSIGAGIGSGLHIKEDAQGEILTILGRDKDRI